MVAVQGPDVAHPSYIQTNIYTYITFLAYFPYFENKKLVLWEHHVVYVSVYSPINFWMPEPNFMKLGTYIMATEPIWTAYFKNPCNQTVWLYMYDGYSESNLRLFQASNVRAEKSSRMRGSVVWLVPSACFRVYRMSYDVSCDW
jgi:hypothetical protein